MKDLLGAIIIIVLTMALAYSGAWCISKGWHHAYDDTPKVQLMVVNK